MLITLNRERFRQDALVAVTRLEHEYFHLTLDNERYFPLFEFTWFSMNEIVKKNGVSKEENVNIPATHEYYK